MLLFSGAIAVNDFPRVSATRYTFPRGYAAIAHRAVPPKTDFQASVIQASVIQASVIQASVNQALQ